VDLGIVTPSDLGGLNDEAGDLMLDERGDVAVVTGGPAIAQHLRVRFQTFRGEVFTDLRVGFPWFEEVLGVKQPDLARIRSFVARTLETTPGVADVLELGVDLDRRARSLAIRWRVKTTDGAVINSADYAPFVLEVAA